MTPVLFQQQSITFSTLSSPTRQQSEHNTSLTTAASFTSFASSPSALGKLHCFLMFTCHLLFPYLRTLPWLAHKYHFGGPPQVAASSFPVRRDSSDYWERRGLRKPGYLLKDGVFMSLCSLRKACSLLRFSQWKVTELFSTLQWKIQWENWLVCLHTESQSKIFFSFVWAYWPVCVYNHDIISPVVISLPVVQLMSPSCQTDISQHESWTLSQFRFICLDQKSHCLRQIYNGCSLQCNIPYPFYSGFG